MSESTHPVNYIRHIQNGKVVIANVTVDLIADLTALEAEISLDPRNDFQQATMFVAPNTDEELAKLLMRLRDLNLLFVDSPAGWPPAAVFQDLRDKGQVSGEIQVVTWHGKGQWMTFTR